MSAAPPAAAAPAVASMSDNTCPICGKHPATLVTTPCCAECQASFANVGKDATTQKAIPIEPLISDSLLDQAATAVAGSEPEKKCCTCKGKMGSQQYYSAMGEWIEQMRTIHQVEQTNEIPKDENEATGLVKNLIYLSFVINCVLLGLKALAVVESDFFAGIMMSCTAAHSTYTLEDVPKYPAGKTKVPTVSILVFAMIMTCAGFFVMVECIMSLLSGANDSKQSNLAIYIIVATICVKICLWIGYGCVKNPMTQTLAEDHRNDFLTNALGLFTYWGSAHLAWWLDSGGGAALSLFIMISWALNAYEDAKTLMGMSAPPEVIRSITFVAMHHHPMIKDIEQVVAWQCGPNFTAELHIVIPGNVPLKIAHWIGETLQLKVEKIPQIERAYVHIDSEVSSDEHMLMIRTTSKGDLAKIQSEADDNPNP